MSEAETNVAKMLRVYEVLDRWREPLRPIILTPEQAAAWRALALPEALIYEQGPIEHGIDLASGSDVVAAFHTTFTADGGMQTREISMSEFYGLYIAGKPTDEQPGAPEGASPEAPEPKAP